MSTQALSVRHNEQAQRFELGQEPQMAVLTYTRKGDLVIFNHTYVPDEFRGLGRGAKLVRAALEEARRLGWKVVPSCWFVAEYIDRNPEFRELVAGGV